MAGHHSAAFTLERYVHLVPGQLGEPLALPGDNQAVLADRDDRRRTFVLGG
jgi:hypothetical protein